MNKKVYITSLHTKHGGCEFVITALANALVKRDFQVEILCAYDFGEVAYPFDERVKVTYLTKVLPNRAELKAAMAKANPFALVKEAIRAIRIIKIRDASVKAAISAIDEGIIISTRDDHNVMLSKYGKPGVLKIAQLHHDHAFDKKLIEDFQKRYDNIDYFLQLTPQSEKEVCEFMEGYNNHTKCITIPNFLDTVEKLSDAPVKKQVIAAGRLHSDKDFFSLLRIWQKVVEKHGDYTLKIAGQGELLEPLRDFAKDLEIENNVDFCGAIPHDSLLREMGESVCYALTSVSESFSLVLAEAMSQGCPCVSFDIRVGPGYLIKDGECGYLIGDRDEDEFAEKICRLIESPDLRAQMGEAAAVRATEFSEENVMKKWLEILQ